MENNAASTEEAAAGNDGLMKLDKKQLVAMLVEARGTNAAMIDKMEQMEKNLMGLMQQMATGAQNVHPQQAQEQPLPAQPSTTPPQLEQQQQHQQQQLSQQPALQTPQQQEEAALARVIGLIERLHVGPRTPTPSIAQMFNGVAALVQQVGEFYGETSKLPGWLQKALDMLVTMPAASNDAQTFAGCFKGAALTWYRQYDESMQGKQGNVMDMLKALVQTKQWELEREFGVWKQQQSVRCSTVEEAYQQVQAWDFIAKTIGPQGGIRTKDVIGVFVTRLPRHLSSLTSECMKQDLAGALTYALEMQGCLPRIEPPRDRQGLRMGEHGKQQQQGGRAPHGQASAHTDRAQASNRDFKQYTKNEEPRRDDFRQRKGKDDKQTDKPRQVKAAAAVEGKDDAEGEENQRDFPEGHN